MIIREIRAKTILSRSKVFDYVINPYTGCQHSCTYCYARFMKRFAGHSEPWGQFVDIKINALFIVKRACGDSLVIVVFEPRIYSSLTDFFN